MRGILRSVQVDIALAAVLTAFEIASVAVQTDGRADWVGYVLAALTFAPIASRQRAPLASTVVMGAAATASLLLGYPGLSDSGAGMLIGLFSVALLRPLPVALVGLGVALVALMVNFAVLVGDVDKLALVGSPAVQCLAAFGIGVSTGRWSRRMERLAEQATRAVAEERIRIAHELHDVVAHHMSVISLQAGVAEYVLDSDREVARDALATVGDTSRAALADMRKLLAVLRVDDPGTQPQPGLSELDGLLDRLRGTGLPVELAVTGTRRPLPPGADLCAYRVAQESLTNVLKHAGPATARLDLDYGERTLTLKITDDGRGARARGTGEPARGIVGMSERAELHGGVLTAGPRPEGGFVVVLRLPCPAAA
ncbi:sensor histidine kinase [Kutzneria sp. CA-103260]|uniref:sensor histidine kinase n=1 Tax=Kutzneria sp. CA-103260 TaxID=2802641 RepID=UPI001BAE190C|nr:sensor histidine kinase [Kutzneria sp. CA-103260]